VWNPKEAWAAPSTWNSLFEVTQAPRRGNSPDVRNGVQPYQINPFTNVDVLVSRLIHFDKLKDDQGRYLVLKMEGGRPAPLGLGAAFDALCP
jgi:hypothetical protein